MEILNRLRGSFEKQMLCFISVIEKQYLLCKHYRQECGSQTLIFTVVHLVLYQNTHVPLFLITQNAVGMNVEFALFFLLPAFCEQNHAPLIHGYK
jgi:hypothetical protein